MVGVQGLKENVLYIHAHFWSRSDQVWIQRAVLTCRFCDSKFEFALQPQFGATHPSGNVGQSHCQFCSRALENLSFICKSEAEEAESQDVVGRLSTPQCALCKGPVTQEEDKLCSP